MTLLYIAVFRKKGIDFRCDDVHGSYVTKL